MRFFILMIVVLSMVACNASKYQYQSQQNYNSWKGRNIADLQKQWGSPDQVLHARDGSSYYVYSTNSGGSFYGSTTTNFAASDEARELGMPIGNRFVTGLKCTNLFKTNSAGTITDVMHRGGNCGGQWVPKATKQTSN
jgi:hypothetical protein